MRLPKHYKDGPLSGRMIVADEWSDGQNVQVVFVHGKAHLYVRRQFQVESVHSEDEVVYVGEHSVQDSVFATTREELLDESARENLAVRITKAVRSPFKASLSKIEIIVDGGVARCIQHFSPSSSMSMIQEMLLTICEQLRKS